MIGIVTVNWRGFEITSELMGQVMASEFADLRLVVVNNSFEEKEKFDANLVNDTRITVFHSEVNKGFSGGVNMGLRELMKDERITHIIIMNNDVELRPDFINRMLQQAKGNNSIYSPLIYFRDTHLIYNTGGKVHLWLGGTVNLNNHVPDYQLKKVKPDYFSGCVLFIPRQVLEKVGLFDETFGTYYEDVDFCYRAKEKGCELEMIWPVTVRHYHSYSTKGENVYKIYLINRNQIIFARKHLKPLPRTVFIVAAVVRGFLMNLKPKRFQHYWRGIQEGFSVRLEGSNL